jgi:hypothetical protein
MSKVDDLRAMREARYERSRAGAAPVKPTSSGPSEPATPVRKAPAKKAPTSAPVADPGQAAEGLCGHRSMNGRTCTRPGGHEEKNHRYG